MNRYLIEVVVGCEIEAFSEEDAKDCLLDALGPGENAGFTILTADIDDIQEL